VPSYRYSLYEARSLDTVAELEELPLDADHV
jgi:hypothetical protein